MQRVDGTRYGEVENVAVSITDENGVDCWWNPVPGLTAAMLRAGNELSRGLKSHKKGG